MRRSTKLILAGGINFMFLSAISLGTNEISPSAQAFQPSPPRLVVASPQAGDNWPIGTRQLIRWATKDVPAVTGQPSDVKVKVELVGQAGAQELMLDDGNLDLTNELGGQIVVLRLTPPSYPATLQTIRLLIPTIMGRSDQQHPITVYYAAEPTGRGSPPDVQQFSTLNQIALSSGSFVDIPIQNGPSVAMPGDFYVGFEIDAPTSGFAFPVDKNSGGRTFIADKNGATFQNANFHDQNMQLVSGNLMIRAIVNVPETTTAISPLGGVDNTGEFCWRVAVSQTPGSMMGSNRQAHIRVSTLPDEQVVGRSDQFTIADALQTITVTTPVSGQTWRMEDNQVIKWDYQNLVGKVRIELLGFTDTQSNPDIAILLYDDVDIVPKQKAWHVRVPRQGIYKVKISSTLDLNIFDESDFFIILNHTDITASPAQDADGLLPSDATGSMAEPAPSACASCGTAPQQAVQASSWIKVVTPNGGEVLHPGDRLNIFWSLSNLTGPVCISLLDLSKPPNDSGFSRMIGQADAATMQYFWIVPFVLGDQLKILVSTDSNVCKTGVGQPGIIADVSDGVFTIGTSASQGKITLLMPDGGETFKVGSQTHILWISQGSDIGDLVRIDISFNGGVSYQLWRDNVTNNGDYLFGINFDPSDRVRIRIVSKRNPFISDVSNCSFRIVR
jgi:hypothetical protein